MTENGLFVICNILEFSIIMFYKFALLYSSD